jgi:malate dehydrogenase (oxaloacetate-decarboxylating)(NADP+)
VTAFTIEERQKYGLTGLLPDVVETMETQIHRVQVQLDNFERPIQKYIYLSGLLDSNETICTSSF